jgi:hypothetical protein
VVDLTTGPLSLNGRAWHRPVGAKYATITRFGANHGFATKAFIEKPALVGGHVSLLTNPQPGHVNTDTRKMIAAATVSLPNFDVATQLDSSTLNRYADIHEARTEFPGNLVLDIMLQFRVIPHGLALEPRIAPSFFFTSLSVIAEWRPRQAVNTSVSHLGGRYAQISVAISGQL